MLGYVRDIHRFPTRDHFASYNGTAPIEVSSGNRKIYRLSRRGNRQLNHAIHMAAVTQIRYRGTEGRAYYDKKIAEGMTGKSALRALKRKISDALYTRMINDARPPASQGPGRANGERLCIQRGRLTPRNAGSSDKPLPGHRQPMTDTAAKEPLTARPAPARRRTSRSAAGVQVEPRPRPRSGSGQERP